VSAFLGHSLDTTLAKLLWPANAAFIVMTICWWRGAVISGVCRMKLTDTMPS